MLKWVLLLGFSLVIVGEVWLVLTLGGILGVGWTMAWMGASFLLGVVLLRIEGVMVLVNIQRQLLQEVIPGRELLEIFFVVVGGVLLILPGFLTDLFGLSMLIPPLRWVYVSLASNAVSRFVLVPAGVPPLAEEEGEIIDITPPSNQGGDAP